MAYWRDRAQLAIDLPVRKPLFPRRFAFVFAAFFVFLGNFFLPHEAVVSSCKDGVFTPLASSRASPMMRSSECSSQEQSNQHIPIIAVMVAPEGFHHDEAMKAGCDAYIVKPIDTRKQPEQVAAVPAKPSQ